MSDVNTGISVFIALLFLGAIYWPVTLLLGMAVAYGATRAHRAWRAVFIVVAVSLIADACYGIWQALV